MLQTQRICVENVPQHGEINFSVFQSWRNQFLYVFNIENQIRVNPYCLLSTIFESIIFKFVRHACTIISFQFFCATKNFQSWIMKILPRGQNAVIFEHEWLNLVAICVVVFPQEKILRNQPTQLVILIHPWYVADYF